MFVSTQSDNSQNIHGLSLTRTEDYFIGSFDAMASPCMVLIDSDDATHSEMLLQIAEFEAKRIETKFSRYRTDNIIFEINHANGRSVEVDDETALLIDYAATCYEISDGLFDITAGILRRAWKFDGSDRVPSQDVVRGALQHIGWQRVRWQNHTITMPEAMEIDLGGIGKEYAVDRVARLIAEKTSCSFLVNFGGDLYASGLRRAARTWAVGIDDPEQTGQRTIYRLDISRAGIATSGDARRYVLWKGKRLGHILNPKTGWPVSDAPRSVTVLARSCIEAGTLSTLAYLQGPAARNFLEEQKVQFWIL